MTYVLADCMDGPAECYGDADEYESDDGITTFVRCTHHLAEYEWRMDEIRRGSSTPWYPEWDGGNP